MLMKWTDLEIGDVVKISDEAKSVMVERDWNWLKEVIKLGNLNILSIDADRDNYRLYLTFQNGDRIFIGPDGKFLGITLFEVVKLKEEENEISK